MKLKHLISAFLVLSILIGACACSFFPVSSSNKVETAVYEYLGNKYPDLEFEIKDYTQDTYTSGRYVLNVFCPSTSVNFIVYHSSFFTTDSYSVNYANTCMEQSLLEMLGEEFTAKYVQFLQWKNVYADKSDGYRFRDMDTAKIPYAVSEVSALYRFVLKVDSYTNEQEAAQAIRTVISEFEKKGMILEEIVFQLKLGKDTVLLKTDTETVQTGTEENLVALLVHIGSAQTTDDIVEVVFGEDLKKAEYFLTDENELPNIETEETTGNTEITGAELQTEN